VCGYPHSNQFSKFGACPLWSEGSWNDLISCALCEEAGDNSHNH